MIKQIFLSCFFKIIYAISMGVWECLKGDSKRAGLLKVCSGKEYLTYSLSPQHPAIWLPLLQRTKEYGERTDSLTLLAPL